MAHCKNLVSSMPSLNCLEISLTGLKFHLSVTAQDFSRAAQKPWNNDHLSRTKPRSLQLRKPAPNHPWQFLLEASLPVWTVYSQAVLHNSGTPLGPTPHLPDMDRYWCSPIETQLGSQLLLHLVYLFWILSLCSFVKSNHWVQYIDPSLQVWSFPRVRFPKLAHSASSWRQSPASQVVSVHTCTIFPGYKTA